MSVNTQRRFLRPGVNFGSLGRVLARKRGSKSDGKSTPSSESYTPSSALPPPPTVPPDRSKPAPQPPPSLDGSYVSSSPLPPPPTTPPHRSKPTPPPPTGALLAEAPSLPEQSHSDSIDGFLTQFLPQEHQPVASVVGEGVVLVSTTNTQSGESVTMSKAGFSENSVGARIIVTQGGVSQTYVQFVS